MKRIHAGLALLPGLALTAAVAAPVIDACADCHPPLALPAEHPPRAGFALADCRVCHRRDTEAGATLLRAMHRGHVASMGFDCTLCHVDAEDDLPTLRTALDRLLEEGDAHDE